MADAPTSRTVDVFISGGGIAGLTAAAALGRLGLSVVVADPMPPVASGGSEGSDLRSTAFLQAARALLERAGLWDALADHATPLDVLRVVDCAGMPPEIQTDRAFQASDLGDAAFGWNLPNWLTRKVLIDAIEAMPGIDLRLGTGFSDLLTREREAIVRLSDGSRVRARLAIGADGVMSPLRQAAGIDVEITRYGQKALAFVVAHDIAHENISTELYLSGGAFTLVPLPDVDGSPASAVVWMNDGSDARALMDLSDDAFSAAATERSCGVLGALRVISPRRVWPIVTQRAKALTTERVALIAEAAHVLPPIGAQGLNTSLADISALVDLAEAAPETLGTAGFLREFARARDKDIRARATAIDLFNRVCRSDAPPVQALRSLGLKAAHDVAPLRKSLMRAGLGG